MTATINTVQQQLEKTGITSSNVSSQKPHDSLDYDIIVLGHGSAGAIAALQAVHMGAKALILEKSDQPGGNSFISSANITMPTDFHKNTKADGRAFADYLTEVAQGTTPRPVINAFIEGLYELPSWLEELGGEFEENKFDRMWTYYIPQITFPHLESAKDVDVKVYHIKQTERHLRGNRNVMIKTGVNVKAIDRPGHDGPVKGVVLQDGTRISSKAVIMTCGGFEANDDLKRDLLGPRRIGLLGSPANTGDGIRLAEKVGAKIWHATAEASVLGFLPPDEGTGFALAMRHPNFIFVNRHAERFINETKLESHRGHSDTAALDHESGKYVNDPLWLIMGEANIKENNKPVLEIFSHKVIREGYKWSDHSVEEIKKGWVKEAQSIDELAEKTMLPEAALKVTLEKWNSTVGEHTEPQGRDKDSLPPIHAPYYAMQLAPMLYNTQGGPQRNERAQILDPDGDIIPGLFGAGELGSVWGHSYQSSTNFSETIVFGRIAGREAAAMIGKTGAGQEEGKISMIEAGVKDPPVAMSDEQLKND